MSDYILVSGADENISCDDCPKPAVVLDGDGSFLCELCTDLKYGQEELQI